MSCFLSHTVKYHNDMTQFVGRLHQLNEFPCFVKAFIYLATYLNRDELLEPVMYEALDQVVCFAKNVFRLMADQQVESFAGSGVNVGFNAAINLWSPKATEVGVPLCEAEPDMFPCLVVICGSAFGFMKVSNK